MRKGLVGICAAACVAAMSASPAWAQEITLAGAGATFPYPLYMKWADAYHELTGLKLNYQSIGSGGGIAQIKAKTVDFGASDAPLTKEEMDAAGGLIQFPMITGGVVPVLSVEGIQPGQLKLTGALLADIYLGKVAQWNDPAIAALNPGLKLPGQAITVVHRADGSGTTWIFTNYLCKVSAEWKEKVGYKTSVKWPAGIGAKGNEGVAANVKTLPGSIGYVEFAYALETKMCHAQLKNRQGKFVEPTFETFMAAAGHADWKSAPGFYMVLTDQPGDNSWPITGASFILIYKQQPDAQKAEAMLKFFDWCYKHGGIIAKGLYYVPMPENVAGLVETRWKDEVSSGAQRVWK